MTRLRNKPLPPTIFKAIIKMWRRPEVWWHLPDGISPRQPSGAGSAACKRGLLRFGKAKRRCHHRSWSCVACWCYKCYTASCSAAGGGFALSTWQPVGHRTDSAARAAPAAASPLPPSMRSGAETRGGLRDALPTPNLSSEEEERAPPLPTQPPSKRFPAPGSRVDA